MVPVAQHQPVQLVVTEPAFGGRAIIQMQQHIFKFYNSFRFSFMVAGISVRGQRANNDEQL